VNIAGGDFVGGLIGYHVNGTVSNCSSTGGISNAPLEAGGLIGYQGGGTVSNCYSEVSIGASGGIYLGGLIGLHSNGNVNNCYSTGSVSGGANLGGLIGEQDGGTISNCYSTGSVTGDMSTPYIGGLIGLQTSSATVINCHSSGGVDGIFANVGGLIGYQQNSTAIACYSTSYVESYHFSIGGLIGLQDGGTAIQCYSANSYVGRKGYIGGLIGEQHGGTVSDCYSRSLIRSDADYGTGGLIGYKSGSAVSNCYSTGYINGNGEFFGGLIGFGNGNAVNNCFWDIETSGKSTSVGGTGESTTAMKTLSTFTDAGWDVAIWNMDEVINNGYPYLKWQDPPLPVELTFFSVSATHSGATLNWKTATEVNNYGFEIERRGISNELPRQEAVTSNWEKVGFVSGSGTSNAPKEYSYFDANLASGRYAYRLKQVDQNGAFKYSQSSEIEVGLVPKELTLAQNYPNPFNPSTTMEFTVPEDGRASLKIYNTIGQLVATAFDGDVKAGYIQKVTVDASHLSSGVYFSRLEYNGKTLLKKLVLMK
jgi:hypothetical protein